MGSVFIQSVDRAFKILEYISKNNSAGISEMSRNLDINKSTVFGLVKTLEKLGYVAQNNTDDKYMLTYKFYILSSRFVDNLPIINIAKPYLKMLNNKYGETIHLVVSTEDSAIYIDKFSGLKSITVSTNVGDKRPLHCTGVGKAILSLRTDEEILEYADKFGLEAFTKNTITNKFKLIEEAEKIRERGYSIDDEETQYDLYCIATSIELDETEYAISVSMPKFRVNDEIKKNIIKDLLNIKDKIIKKLD
ncbi:IclR family transcriptional regulator [Miniphocaeibacter halophilus]|uniref:IclR family transcriptional regulator n=1 Tax=Miniphocaeibacter halophilus TaxID=2931922 RepID=A0AC61MT53_9FIRM|nr:IclR family transcriptional regulator [Miniphocaeibacter halophilus]QQK07594.1 IclR family transcriptional regulator [Miniphocaeibacter halophilus]